VLTLTRTGYLAQCPNVGRLLQNLQFTTGGESEIMQAMVAGKQPPEVAARAWLRAHPTTVALWLQGVATIGGRTAGGVPGGGSVRGIGAQFEPWLASHKLPVATRWRAASSG